MNHDDDDFLSEDDISLWEQVTRDAKRMPGKQLKKAKKPKVHEKPLVMPKQEARPASVAPSKPPMQEKPALPYLHAGDIIGLDRNNAEKLRKGKWPIQGTLDLHGMIQEEAFEALTDFIRISATRGKRCVLVITGKGSRSGGGAGVLRANAPRWLNALQVRPYILAFTHAQPQHGGDGALYVLLRRQGAS